ncbi:hypothetical protein [Marispirochaeta aestuarii]|uniref:hypothetical protein n=1 Tax=Marispirochaeta aestuarii TaxID=1963862 RepID=UPI002ABD5587|nr:hypothetical protein [Marispirochaeta aestuarii]
MWPQAFGLPARIVQVFLLFLIVLSCQEPFFLETVVDGNLEGDEIPAEEAFIDYAVSRPEPDDSGPYSVSTALSGTFDIVNTGVTNGVSSVQWGVYASKSNPVWGTNDYQVASASVAALDGGTGTTVNFSGTWPSVTGIYYLVVRISSIDDGNTDNNEESSGPYTVQ